MNLREELYKSGAGLTVRVVSAKHGRRVAVLDPYRRVRAAMMALLSEGMHPRDAAHRLGIPVVFACNLALRALSEGRRAKK